MILICVPLDSPKICFFFIDNIRHVICNLTYYLYTITLHSLITSFKDVNTTKLTLPCVLKCVSMVFY